MHESPQQIVSKAEYAQLRNRDPSAVSHWIRHGRLTAPALIGEGRRARINVPLADKQLSGSLSVGHQVGFAIREEGRDIIAPPAAAEPKTPSAPSDQQRLLAARAQREEIAAQEAFIAAQVRNGSWVVRAEAEQEHARRLAETVAAFERWLPRLAQEIAASAGGDVRELTMLARTKFRELRAELAQEARAEAEAA